MLRFAIASLPAGKQAQEVICRVTSFVVGFITPRGDARKDCGFTLAAGRAKML